MAELFAISLFIIILVASILLQGSIVIALLCGFFCFAGYAYSRGFSVKEITRMAYAGIRQATTILVVFTLIGMLTALWRASGTIAFIIYHSVPLIRPELFVLSSFLLCALISLLTGTSFGTVSTMGVICMTTGRALGIPPFYLGGAILSGIYFGDRCSPMSSSALLVSSLTGTNIYRNVANMIKTALVPTIITLAVYYFTGHVQLEQVESADTISLFAKSYLLTPWTLLPALLILALSCLRLDVRITMSASIAASILICLLFQKMPLSELLSCMFFGYRAKEPELAALMNGGGFLSMLETSVVIAVSSSYFGIFRKTKLLDQIKKWSHYLAEHTTNFFSIFVVSIATVAVSCNQTLSTMLTYEISEKLVPDKEQMAVYLENSVIIMCALIPWSIAITFPLAAIGAPLSCITYAVYLYAVPLWTLFLSFFPARKAKKQPS